MAGVKDKGHARTSRRLLLIGSAGVLLAGEVLAAPVDLIRQDLAGSTCMDGTPAAFYYDENATASDEWVVILQGSNICFNVAGDQRVEAAAVGECARWCFANEASAAMPLDLTGRTDDGTLGQCDLPQASSSNWTPTLSKGSLFDDDMSDNPSFHDAQKIYVRSCSGDGWVGDATDVAVNGPVATPLRTFDFHGTRIIDEMFDVLIDTGLQVVDQNGYEVTVQLSDGDSVLFGGESRALSAPGPISIASAAI